jgi:hypothetical protein
VAFLSPDSALKQEEIKLFNVVNVAISIGSSLREPFPWQFCKQLRANGIVPPGCFLLTQLIITESGALNAAG